MKVHDLKGRAVVTLSDAAKVGQVEDVLFDPEYREVLGFRVKMGAFTRSEVVRRADVSAIGADALTVPSAAVVNVEDRFPDLAGAATASKAQGTKVVTEGGDLVGTVAELEVDPEVHFVTEYILSVPLWDKLLHREPRISAHQILRLGEGGILLISSDTAQHLRSRNEPQDAADGDDSQQ